jgi:hypothetical protein
MVNVGFPARLRYGFERVDAQIARISGARAHQSKIYIESNQSDFQPIFGEFTSMRTLTIYRRLLVRSKLRHQPQSNQKR